MFFPSLYFHKKKENNPSFLLLRLVTIWNIDSAQCMTCRHRRVISVAVLSLIYISDKVINYICLHRATGGLVRPKV